MDELIDLLAKGISAAIAAKNAKDDAAVAAALAELDGVIAQVSPVAQKVPDEIAANRAAALDALAKKFPVSDGPAAEAETPPPSVPEVASTEEETKP